MFHLYKLFYQKVAVTFARLISKAYQKMNSLSIFSPFLSLFLSSFLLYPIIRWPPLPLFPERERCRCSCSGQLQTLLSTCPALILQYELRLTASDNLKENYTTVVIHVKDVNDNPPVFERPTYKTQITEEDDRTLPKRVLGVITSFLTRLNEFSKESNYSKENQARASSISFESRFDRAELEKCPCISILL